MLIDRSAFINRGTDNVNTTSQVTVLPYLWLIIYFTTYLPTITISRISSDIMKWFQNWQNWLLLIGTFSSIILLKSDDVCYFYWRSIYRFCSPRFDTRDWQASCMKLLWNKRINIAAKYGTSLKPFGRWRRAGIAIDNIGPIIVIQRRRFNLGPHRDTNEIQRGAPFSWNM